MPLLLDSLPYYIIFLIFHLPFYLTYFNIFILIITNLLNTNFRLSLSSFHKTYFHKTYSISNQPQRLNSMFSLPLHLISQIRPRFPRFHVQFRDFSAGFDPTARPRTMPCRPQNERRVWNTSKWVLRCFSPLK